MVNFLMLLLDVQLQQHLVSFVRYGPEQVAFLFEGMIVLVLALALLALLLVLLVLLVPFVVLQMSFYQQL
jgi:hypothetical protein